MCVFIDRQDRIRKSEMLSKKINVINLTPSDTF